MPKPYMEVVEQQASASKQTVVGSKVPEGKVLKVTMLAAYQRVSASGLQPYETAKWQLVGLKKGDQYAVVRGKDIATTNTVLAASGTIWAAEGWQPFVQHEGSATTNVVHLVTSGLLYDEDELTSKRMVNNN